MKLCHVGVGQPPFCYVLVFLFLSRTCQILVVGTLRRIVLVFGYLVFLSDFFISFFFRFAAFQLELGKQRNKQRRFFFF